MPNRIPPSVLTGKRVLYDIGTHRLKRVSFLEPIHQAILKQQSSM